MPTKAFMNLIPKLLIYRKTMCRKPSFSKLKIILLPLLLSGCLKVTGPAKDSFDLENEEPKLNLSGLIFNKKTTDANEEAAAKTAPLENSERTDDANLSTPSDNRPDKTGGDLSSETANRTSDFQPELPEQDILTLSPQDIVEFDLWKKARSEDSIEYQKFREYLEFKEYQKWLKLQNESEPD